MKPMNSSPLIPATRVCRPNRLRKPRLLPARVGLYFLVLGGLILAAYFLA